MSRLSGKAGIVTGAAGGIGSAASRAFAAEGAFVGAVACPTVDGQHALDFPVRAGNDVDADQFSDAAGGGCSRIGRRFDRADIAAHKDRHISGADILFT